MEFGICCQGYRDMAEKWIIEDLGRFCFTMLKTKLVFKIKETTLNRTEKRKERFKDI